MDRKSGRCGKCSSAAAMASTTSTAAACTRPTRSMALQNARDVYTRRQEGVSIWVVRVRSHRRLRPGRQAGAVRSGRGQDLPASDVLSIAGRSGSYVSE